MPINLVEKERKKLIVGILIKFDNRGWWHACRSLKDLADSLKENNRVQ